MTAYSPNLPWNDSNDKKRFFPILITMLSLVLIFGAIIPRLKVPAPSRAELEKVPAQLAKVIERKKLEPVKPVEPPKVVVPKPEPKVEPKPEPKPEPKIEPKPEPKPEPTPVPKIEPKPEPKPKVQATVEQREKAKENVKKSFGNDALAALQSTRNAVPIAALNTSSKGLSNQGQQATQVGSVVDRNAASRTSGGVDSRNLTVATVGENLGSRQVTQVQMTAEQKEATKDSASRNRSQEELRLVFEQYKVDFDRLYRMALRKNSALAGSVTLSLSVSPDGSVASCTVLRSELNDADLHKRLEMKCRQMKFDARKNVDTTKVEFPIRFMP